MDRGGFLLRFFVRRWAVLLATAFLLTLVGVEIRQIKAAEGGRFVYPIDDMYMHMATAKNLLRHGSWAVSPYNGFCSCISSLIWPCIIAVTFALFGIHDYYPIILNVLAAVGLFFYADGMIRRATGSSVLSALILCAIVFLTPLTVVVLLGMEHTLQALASVLFVDLAARVLSRDEHQVHTPRADVGLCAAAVLLVLSRYEGLFLVAIVGLLLLCSRRWMLAILLGAAAGAPLVIFGMISMAKGWAFFPNSLLLKGNTHPTMTLLGLVEYFSKGYVLMSSQPHFLMTVAALTAALVASIQRGRSLWNYSTLILLITFVATIEHLQFASLGWFYRYEAYLIVLALLGVGIALGQNLPRPAAAYWLRLPGLTNLAIIAAAGLIFGAPLWQRSMQSLGHTVSASYNIYEQQYQMGRFIRQFYNGRGVAANDIGAITFLGDIKLLDTAGLANLEVLRARQKGDFTQDRMRRLAKQFDVELVMVYDAWNDIFKGPLPEWVPVGRWTIPHNTVCGSDTVSFYAPEQKFAPGLTRELQEFARNLPKDVVQDGVYVGRSSYVSETQGPETSPECTLYWTGGRAGFDLYPQRGEAIGSDDTTLTLSYIPMMPDQRIEIFFNNQLVSNESVAPGTSGTWKSVTIKAKWLPGKNVLMFAGHGSLFKAPGDTRQLMYQVLDPLQVMGPYGKVTKPGVPAGLP